MIRCNCPNCAKPLRAGDDKAGATVACPQCGHKFRLPAPQVDVRAVPPPLPASLPQPAPEPVLDEAPRRRLRFDAEPHRAAGILNVPGALLVLVMVMVAAVMMGWLASFLGQWFYLILVFPICIAAGVLFAGGMAMHWGKISCTRFGCLAGIFGGTVAMLTMHYFDYIHLGGKAAGLTFGQFVDARATVGVQLLGRGGGGGINLGYVGSFIYFGLEFLAVVAICGSAAVVLASKPFCEECNRWKEANDLGTRRVVVEEEKTETIDAIQRAFAEGRLSRLARDDPDAETIKIALTAYICPGCGDEGAVEAQLHWFDLDDKGKPAKKDLPLISYSPEALPVFQSLFHPDLEEDADEDDDDAAPRKRKKRRPASDDYDDDDDPPPRPRKKRRED